MKKFEEFALAPGILKKIQSQKFEVCTEVQENVIPHILQQQNVACYSKTGTGKTASFLIPILDKFLKTPERYRQKGIYCLIFAPTRELVTQIDSDLQKLVPHNGITHLAVYGGTGYKEQQDRLEEFPDIVVATTGRFIDFHRKRLIPLKDVETIVLDEVDRMCDMGFKKDLDYIFHNIKQNYQVLAFSATHSKDVDSFIRSHVHEYKLVDVGQDQLTPVNIEQTALLCSTHQKLDLLIGILIAEKPVSCLIFVNMKHTGSRLHIALQKKGISSHLLSGDVPQNKRTRIIDDMKKGLIPLLITTDVGARGLHIESVSHVINFDIPFEAENYVHRIGRTGRLGKKGKSITLACEEYAEFLEPLNNMLTTKLLCEWPAKELLEYEIPKSFGMARVAPPQKKQPDKKAPQANKPRSGQVTRAGSGNKPVNPVAGKPVNPVAGKPINPIAHKSTDPAPSSPSTSQNKTTLITRIKHFFAKKQK